MRNLLGFSSTVLAQLNTERGGLVLSFAMGARLPFLREAATLLGFDPTGAVLPLWAEDSIFIRCYRQGRIMASTELSDLYQGVVPEETMGPFASFIGPRLFVCVPVPGVSGAIVAVVLLDRRDISPLTAEERDQLLLYAARLGRFLEAQRLGSPLVAGPATPVTRWLSVHLLDHELQPVWSGGTGPAAGSLVAALGGQPKPGQFELTLGDGRAVLVTVHFISPGSRVTWLLLCENLARRDREVRELQEQLRLRLARVREAVVTVDANLRVVASNDAVRAVLGYEPAEIIGEKVESFLSTGRVTSRHMATIGQLLSRGYAESKVRLQRRDGTRFPAEVSLLLSLQEGEGPTGAIATIRDLSEQKRLTAEKGRLRRQVLRSERLAALGEMAARIAHEVRNPLASIGAAALAIEEDEGSGRDARGQAQAIGREVRRLDGILHDLLQFARPRAATQQSVNLPALVRESLTVARVDGAAADLTFSLNCPDSARPVKADPDGLRQVLRNLLRNAIEASPSGATVSCRLREQDNMVWLDVADRGPGLAAEARRRAFEPFYSTKSRGTGLGLPISRGIVKAQGGELLLRPRRGGGTTASLGLKVSDEPCAN
jgi:PAS domain S-box-containing protein